MDIFSGIKPFLSKAWSSIRSYLLDKWKKQEEKSHVPFVKDYNENEGNKISDSQKLTVDSPGGQPIIIVIGRIDENSIVNISLNMEKNKKQIEEKDLVKLDKLSKEYDTPKTSGESLAKKTRQ